MPNHPNTDEIENPLLNAEDWEIAFELYAGHHHEAIGLASRFMVLREYLKSKPPRISLALAAIDGAAETLYTHTDYPKSAYALYRTQIEGKATKADEDLIESLGVEI